MKKIVKKHLKTILFVLVGAVAGYLYYALVGCVTGSCAITSNPVASTLYGGVFGLLLSFIFSKSPKKQQPPPAPPA